MWKDQFIDHSQAFWSYTGANPPPFSYESRAGGRDAYSSAVWPVKAPAPPRPYYRYLVEIQPGILNYSHTLDFGPDSTPRYRTFVRSGDFLPNASFNWEGYNGHTTPIINSTITKLTNLLVTKANSRVKDQQWDAGTFLSELPSTLRELVKDASLLIKAARSVRKGRFGEAASVLSGRSGAPSHIPNGLKGKGPSASRFFSENWLKYSFQYSPIVSDMVGAAIALSEASRSSDPYFKVRVSKSEEISISSSEMQFGIPGAFGGGDIYCKLESQLLLGVSLTYYFRIDSPTRDKLSQIGLSNPLQTGWELLPFSWVVDYFSNVGDILSNLDTWTGKSFIHGHRSMRLDFSQSLNLVRWNPPTGSVSSACNIGSTITRRSGFETWREPLSAPLSEKLIISLPENYLASKFLNLTSVLRQMFSH